MHQLFKNKWTALFLSNFLGVFNDNFLKNAIIFISVVWVLPSWMTQSQLISIVSACLIIPYLILSPIGGRLAVIYSKKKVFRFFKLLEIPIMMIASVAFYFQNTLLAIFAVLLMGIQSCLYSPSKYSLIRDIGGEEGVSFGSGVFETMAFMGILIGTVTASVISDTGFHWLVYLIFLGVALAGYIVTRAIRATELPESETDNIQLHPVGFILDSYRFAKQYPLLHPAIFGASAFWLIGGMLQMNLVIHTKNIYHATNTMTGFVMAMAAVGIAMGCWVAGKVTVNQSGKGLILIGIIAMSVMLTVLTFVHLNFSFYVVFVFTTAFSGGFFQVPNLTIIQQSGVGRKLGDMVAYLNLVTFIFVLTGTFLFWLITLISNENSFVVFGSILTVCILVSVCFIFKSDIFYKETFKLLKKNQP